MLRITDNCVAHWEFFVWKQGKEWVEQVEVYLYNGMIFILDAKDFFEIADDGGW